MSRKIIKLRIGLLQLGNSSHKHTKLWDIVDNFTAIKNSWSKMTRRALWDQLQETLLKNRISANVEDAVINCCRVSAYGQEKAATQLRRRGIIISGSNIRSVWLLSDFESFKKHLMPILMFIFHTLKKLAI
jgi:hypothetical protein